MFNLDGSTIGLLIAGLAIFGAAMFGLPMFQNYVGSKKIKVITAADKKDNADLQEHIKEVDNKEDAVNISVAKIDQKLEDLKNEKVTNEDIVSFLNDMEKKAKD